MLNRNNDLAEKEHGMSAFDLGQKVGRGPTPKEQNPFEIGSREHNNFEVGRRFGASSAVSRERDKEHPYAVSSEEES